MASLLLPGRSSSVGHGAVTVDYQLDEPSGWRELGRLPFELCLGQASTLAGHPGEEESTSTGDDCVVRLSESAGTESAEVVENRVAKQLNGISRQEEIDIVSLVNSRSGDQEAEGRASRRLGPVGEVDEQGSHGQSVVFPPCRNLGSILETRIQLCGRIVAILDGRRLEPELPGRQGRLLFAYLAANRLRAASRAELMDAVWPGGLPGSPDSALSALVSKLRRVVGQERLEGRSELRLAFPDDTWVDVEAATRALHRAEAAQARSDWPEAWVAARVAQHIAVRPFVVGENAGWIEERRRHMEGVYLRALELSAHASLRIGGGELDTAERSARSLVQQAPFRESGYRYLMEVLAARGNRADALHVYEQLRTLLRDELGAPPSPATQELHRALLG